MYNKIIYVAGPLTPRSDNQNHAIEYLTNVKRMLGIGQWLINKGFAPYIPGMDFPLFLFGDAPSEGCIKGMSMAFLRASAAVLVVGDYSKSGGTQAEIEEAKALGIPVFKSRGELMSWEEKRNEPIVEQVPA